MEAPCDYIILLLPCYNQDHKQGVYICIHAISGRNKEKFSSRKLLNCYYKEITEKEYPKRLSKQTK
jgi:hypothetical protein